MRHLAAANDSRRTRWAPNLAAGIGSARWFAEFALLLGLCAGALSLWPELAVTGPAGAIEADKRIRVELEQLKLRPIGEVAGPRALPIPSAAVIALPAFPERPSIDVTVRLLPAEPVFAMLRRAGVGTAEARRIAWLTSQALPEAQYEPGWPSHIVLGKRPAAGRPRAFESAVLRTGLRHSVTVAGFGSDFTVAHRPIAAIAQRTRIRGTVGASLSKTLLSYGLPPDLQRQYLDAIAAGLESANTGPQASDRFDIVLATERASDGQVKLGEILFAGLERAGRPVAQGVRTGPISEFAANTGAPLPLARTAASWPVAGRLSSVFGFRRHPILGYFRMHSGVDLAALAGTPIYAPAAGIVAKAGLHGGYGNYLRLDHGGSTATAYGHLSRVAVAPGESVSRGQMIGWVGSSGLATGPHLHFEVLRGGRAIDPITAGSLARAQRPSGDDRKDFDARIAQFRTIAPSERLPALR